MSNVADDRGRRGRLSAKELKTRLESEPEWVALQEKVIEERRAQVAKNLKDLAPILADLADAGYEVESISELYQSFPSYRSAIPILLRWLPQLNNIDLKEGIVRALTDRAAKPLAGPMLAEEFRTISCPPSVTELRLEHYKAAVANALSVVADDLMFDEISQLIQDRRHGWTRAPLAAALRRMKNPEATDVLERVLTEEADRLSDDAPALIVHTMRALGNRKAVRARRVVARLLDHSSPIVRKEAQRTLDKFDRAEQKT